MDNQSQEKQYLPDPPSEVIINMDHLKTAGDLLRENNKKISDELSMIHFGEFCKFHALPRIKLLEAQKSLLINDIVFVAIHRQENGEFNDTILAQLSHEGGDFVDCLDEVLMMVSMKDLFFMVQPQSGNIYSYFVLSYLPLGEVDRVFRMIAAARDGNIHTYSWKEIVAQYEDQDHTH